MSFSDLAVFVMIVAGLAGFGATVKWLYSPARDRKRLHKKAPDVKARLLEEAENHDRIARGYLPMRRTSAAFTRDEQ